MANRRSTRLFLSRHGLEVILILVAGLMMGFLENYRLEASKPFASVASNLEGVLIWLVFLAPLVLSAIEKRPGLGFVLGVVLGIGMAIGLALVPEDHPYVTSAQAILQGLGIGVLSACIAALVRWFSSIKRTHYSGKTSSTGNQVTPIISTTQNNQERLVDGEARIGLAPVTTKITKPEELHQDREAATALQSPNSTTVHRVMRWFADNPMAAYAVVAFIWNFCIVVTTGILISAQDQTIGIFSVLGFSAIMAFSMAIYMLFLRSDFMIQLDNKWRKAIAEDRLPWWVGIMRLSIVVLPYWVSGWVPEKVTDWYLKKYVVGESLAEASEQEATESQEES